MLLRIWSWGILGFMCCNSLATQAPITTVIIPAAGLGSRLLPCTLAVPKEMLPLIDKPAIQMVLEECAASQLARALIIINDRKQAIIDFLTPESAAHLQAKAYGHGEKIAGVTSLVGKIALDFCIQHEQRGSGHALLMAEERVPANEFFAVCFPDDIIVNDEPGIGQLMALAQQFNATIVAVKEFPAEQCSLYGVITPGKQINSDLMEITSVVEKPSKDALPSRMAVIGRYVFSPAIFKVLHEQEALLRSLRELGVTDGIAGLIARGERVLAYKIKGDRYDTGVPQGWLSAVIHEAWRKPLYRDQVREIVYGLEP